jgi:hypothetical protein
MKILKILPLVKAKHQLYEVLYLENLVECKITEREKKIRQIFVIDKEEFKKILMNSISSELYES